MFRVMVLDKAHLALHEILLGFLLGLRGFAVLGMFGVFGVLRGWGVVSCFLSGLYKGICVDLRCI